MSALEKVLGWLLTIVLLVAIGEAFGIAALQGQLAVQKAALRTQVDWEQQLAQCNNRVQKRTRTLAARERTLAACDLVVRGDVHFQMALTDRIEICESKLRAKR